MTLEDFKERMLSGIRGSMESSVDDCVDGLYEEAVCSAKSDSDL